MSAVSLSVPTAALTSGEYDFAFSFWGGIFFVYTASTAGSDGPTTDVSAFDPATGKTSVVLSQIGFNVVGAGSSTCVPTQGDLTSVFPADAAAASDATVDAEVSTDAASVDAEVSTDAASVDAAVPTDAAPGDAKNADP